MAKKEEREIKNQKNFPIGVKLALIIGFIVLASLGTVTFLNSYFVSQDVRITAEENNLTINTRSASTAQNKFYSVRSNVLQLLDLINAASGGKSSALAKQAEAFFFERNQDIAEIIILTLRPGHSDFLINNQLKNLRFFTSNEIEPDITSTFLGQTGREIERACRGEIIALNASPFYRVGLLALLLPIVKAVLTSAALFYSVWKTFLTFLEAEAQIRLL